MHHTMVKVCRTPTQVVLYLVSMVMLGIGGLVALLGGVLVYACVQGLGGLSMGELWVSISVLICAALLLVTGYLGYRAAKDSSQIGPYRFFCYLVCLVILIVLGYGWADGQMLIFNPLVLAATVLYVLVCSSLADKIEQEYKDGVKGELIVRDAHQQTLHFLAALITAEGIFYLVVAVIALIVSFGFFGVELPHELADASTAVQDIQLPFGWDINQVQAVQTAVSGTLYLLVGLLGIRGSNHPAKIRPFFIASLIMLLLAAFAFVGEVVTNGLLTPNMPGTLFGLVFSIACTYLAYQINRSNKVEKDVLLEV